MNKNHGNGHSYGNNYGRGDPQAAQTTQMSTTTAAAILRGC